MTNSKLTRKFISVVLAFVMLFAITMPVVASPKTGGIALITDFSGGNGGSVRDRGRNYSPINGYNDTIYFGSYKNNGILWRVMANDPSAGKIYLLSDKVLKYRNYTYNLFKANYWSKSDIRNDLNDRTTTGTFANTAFSKEEWSAIKETTHTTYGWDSEEVTDRVYLLSIQEIHNEDYGFEPKDVMSDTYVARNTSGELSTNWWLCSGDSNFLTVITVAGREIVTQSNDNFIRNHYGVRPVLNIDHSQVLFASAATGGKGKVNIGDGFNLDNTYTGSNGWKLTLKKSTLSPPANIEISQEKTPDTVDNLAAAAGQGGTVDLSDGLKVTYGDVLVSFRGNDGNANYTSALVAKEATPSKYVNYAKISTYTTETEKRVPLAGLTEDGIYRMYIYSEIANGDYTTDYASPFATHTDEKGKEVDYYTIKVGSYYECFAGWISATYKDKGLTAKLANGFNLTFDADTFDTNIELQKNYVSSGTITGTGTTLTGKVTVGSNQTLGVAGNLTLTGDAKVEQVGTLNICAGSNVTLGGSVKVEYRGTMNILAQQNDVAMSLTDEGTLNINEYTRFNKNASIVLGKYGKFNVNAGTKIVCNINPDGISGKVNVASNQTLDIVGSIAKIKELNNNNGSIITNSGTALELDTVTNSGSMFLNGTTTISGNVNEAGIAGTISNYGNLIFNGSKIKVSKISNAGTLKITNGEINAKITGKGTLEIASTGGNIVKYTGTEKIGNKLLIDSGATFDPVADLLPDDTTNKGNLYLQGGTLSADIKGAGTTYLQDPNNPYQTYILTVNSDRKIEGTLNTGYQSKIDMTGETEEQGKIHTLTVGTLAGHMSLKIDVDMSNFSSDNLVINSDTVTTVVNLVGINITKDIFSTSNEIELPKSENDKITYVNGASKGSYFVNGSEFGSIVRTNNYKYTFTPGSKGKVNYKVEATDLTFKKFMEGSLSGDPKILSLTDNLANTGSEIATITESGDKTINLNGHKLTSDSTSTICVGANTLTIDGGTTEGTIDENTNFEVSAKGTMLVTGITNIKGAVSGTGTMKNTGTLTACGISITTLDNDGTLNIAADKLSSNNVYNTSGTLNLTGDGKTLASNVVITDGTVNIKGDISMVGGSLKKGTSGSDALVITTGKTLTITGGDLTRNVTGTTGTLKFTGTSNSAVDIASAVTVSETGNLTNTGTISGAVTNDGTMKNKGTISSLVTNAGAFTTTANGILSGVANSGTVTLTGSGIDLVSDITGTGKTIIDGTISLPSERSIANSVTVNDDATLTNEGTINDAVTNNGLFITTVDGIKGGVANNNSLTLKGDNVALASDITGAGTTEIDGTITSAMSISNDVTVRAGSTFTNTGLVSGDVTNNGTFETNAKSITGTVTNNATFTLTGTGDCLAKIVNNETMTINPTSDISITSITSDGAQGTLTVNGTGTVTMTGELTQDKLTIAEDGRLDFDSQNLNVETITNNGELNLKQAISFTDKTIKGSGTLGIWQDVTNDGILEQGTLNIASNATFTNNGIVKSNIGQTNSNDASGQFLNVGIWYPNFASGTSETGNIINSDGIMDIAYNSLDDTLSPTYDETRTDFHEVSVASLTLQKDSMLIVQSNVKNNKADKLTVSSLSPNSNLQISVAWDPCFDGKTSVKDKSATVLTADDISSLTITALAAAVDKYLYTPIFAKNSNNLNLTGFDVTACDLNSAVKNGAVVSYNLITGTETIAANLGDLARLDVEDAREFTLTGDGKYLSTIDGAGKIGIIMGKTPEGEVKSKLWCKLPFRYILLLPRKCLTSRISCILIVEVFQS